MRKDFLQQREEERQALEDRLAELNSKDMRASTRKKKKKSAWKRKSTRINATASALSKNVSKSANALKNKGLRKNAAPKSNACKRSSGRKRPSSRKSG